MANIKDPIFCLCLPTSLEFAVGSGIFWKEVRVMLLFQLTQKGFRSRYVIQPRYSPSRIFIRAVMQIIL